MVNQKQDSVKPPARSHSIKYLDKKTATTPQNIKNKQTNKKTTTSQNISPQKIIESKFSPPEVISVPPPRMFCCSRAPAPSYRSYPPSSVAPKRCLLSVRCSKKEVRKCLRAIVAYLGICLLKVTRYGCFQK